jgi:hypothetical protein
MAQDWTAAKKKAMGILGPKGKIPEPTATVFKRARKNGQIWDEFVASRQELRTILTKHQGSFDAFVGAVQASRDEVKKDNLGLDPKIKADATKIAEARKVLLSSIDGSIKIHEAKLAELKAWISLLLLLLIIRRGPSPAYSHDMGVHRTD